MKSLSIAALVSMVAVSSAAPGMVDAARAQDFPAGAIVEPGDVADAEAPALAVRPPSWYTPELHQRILAAGARGVDIPMPAASDRATELNCLGYSPAYASTDGVSVNAVSAGGCMVAPAGCTMNFVFTDGTSFYIAGHDCQSARELLGSGSEQPTGGLSGGLRRVKRSRLLEIGAPRGLASSDSDGP